MERHTRKFAESILLESLRVSRILFKNHPADDLDYIVGQHLGTLKSIRAGDDRHASYILDMTRWAIGFQLYRAHRKGIAVDQAALDWVMC